MSREFYDVQVTLTEGVEVRGDEGFAFSAGIVEGQREELPGLLEGANVKVGVRPLVAATWKGVPRRTFPAKLVVEPGKVHISWRDVPESVAMAWLKPAPTDRVFG